MIPQRRHWVLTSGVAAAAVATGAGWAVWRQRAAVTPGAEASLWTSEFPSPDGSTLRIASLRGQPLLINFWATWCAPCIREMPALDRFQRDFGARGWRVVGLAVDQMQPVREFLARMPVGFAIGLVGTGGIELSRRLGNHAGGLPFTLAFGRDGRLLQRHIGETRYAQLADWAKMAD